MRDFLDEGGGREEAGIDLTPMLDVVFIMLIFFIVTASFVKEAGFDVNRPPNTDQPPRDDERKNILINVAADGRLYINRRPVDPGALTANIKRLHAENPKGAVVIQAEDDSMNEYLITVMDAARKAGVYDVAIASN